MWKMLKAEFEYSKGIILTAYLLTFLTLIICWQLEVGGVYLLSAATTIIFFFSIPIMGSRSDKEKRDRFYVGLPVTLKQISVNRLLFMILFQAGIFFIWGIIFFLDHFGHDNQAIWTMITTSAFVIIIIEFFVLYHDFGYFQTGQYRMIYIMTLIFFFSGLIGSVTNDLINPEAISFGNTIRKTFWDAAVYCMLCFGMLYFNHQLFMRRKSYLS